MGLSHIEVFGCIVAPQKMAVVPSFLGVFRNRSIRAGIIRTQEWP